MSTFDLVIIVLYLSMMIGIGVYFSIKNKNSNQFSVASTKIPGWALGLSFYATFLSAITFLGDPGKSFGSNWNPFVFSLSMPFAAIISAKYFVPYYRNSGEISAYTPLEKRFGAWARTYAMVCFILTQLARMGTIFYGIALTINALTGYSLPIIIILSGICIIVYTVLGGMEAVIWTEVIQAIIKTIGAITILGIILSQVGINDVISKGLTQDKFSLGTFNFDLTVSSFWVVFLYGFFINLTNFGVDQNYIQRYHSAKNSREASRSIWLCVIYYLPVSFLFFFIGTALFVYYAQYPELIETLKLQVSQEKNIAITSLIPTDYADKVLPYFIKTQIPTGILGVLIAAILSAAMSTMSSGMNSSATVFLNDIYLRYINKDKAQVNELKILRITTVAMGILGIIFGISMIGVKSLLDVWWKLSGIFAGGMLGIFLLGFLVKNAKNIHAKLGIICGILMIIWLTVGDLLPENIRSPFDSKMNMAFGTITIILVGYLASLLMKTDKTD
jgi:solute:Na+ symporter, SSS family